MKCFLIIILLLGAFSIHSQTLSNHDKDEILKVLDEQRLSWNEGNIEAYMNGYWKSDSLRFIGKRGVNYGWNATLESYKKGYPDNEAMGVLLFEVISLECLSENIAFMIGKWKIERKTNSLDGHFTLIWKKINGNWKITIDHSS